MAKDYIQASRGFRTYILDPARVCIAGIDFDADPESSIELDIASNAAAPPERMITDVGETARLSRENAPKSVKMHVGNVEPAAFCREQIDANDKTAYIDANGTAHPYRVVMTRGRTRVRSMRAWNERHNLVPSDPEYVWLLAFTDDRLSAVDQRIHARIAENHVRRALDPVAEGREIQRLAVILATKRAKGNPKPANISAALKEISATRGEDPGTTVNKAKLADLVPEIAARVKAGEIKASSAYKLARIDPADQLTVLNSAQSTKHADIKSAVEAYNRAKRPDDKRVNKKSKRPSPKALNELATSVAGVSPDIALALRFAAGDIDEGTIMARVRELSQTSPRVNSTPAVDCGGIGGVHAM